MSVQLEVPQKRNGFPGGELGDVSLAGLPEGVLIENLGKDQG